MDDEWDLHAVVRGCAATVTTTTTTTTTTSTTTDNPFPSSSPLPLHIDENLFNFPGVIDDRINPFQGLQEIYREFCVDQSSPAVAAAVDVTGTSTISMVVGQDFQSQQLTQPPDQEILQMPPLHQMNMPRSQENMPVKNPVFGSSSLTFPAGNSHPIRPRRRKNQQLKMVREMTQEELSADSWAWRKYGQKPIKGSPYPRNYYRCSTSKGCAARKQVERSPNDPAIFVVSYTGEHTHPRPTHRSSLAGSTRNKLSPATASGTKQNTVASPFPKGSRSSSSPASGSCFSPNTSLTEGETAVDVGVMGEDEGDGGDGDDDNNNTMIPNDHLMNDDEDMFKGFGDSDHSSGGGDFFSSGLVPSPPWTPTSSTVTTATFTSGGGG